MFSKKYYLESSFVHEEIHSAVPNIKNWIFCFFLLVFDLQYILAPSPFIESGHWSLNRAEHTLWPVDLLTLGSNDIWVQTQV